MTGPEVISLSLKKLEEAALGMPRDYRMAVLKSCTRIDGDTAWMPVHEWKSLKARYAVHRKKRPHAAQIKGVGGYLKAMLGKLGIKPEGNCKCNARAREMDERGVDWCESHIETIVGWLAEEAAARRLPFVPMVARLLVKRAIRLARSGRPDPR